MDSISKPSNPSSISSSSSPSSVRTWATEVGGICLESPTTMTALALPIAPIEWATRICEASSKTTKSNGGKSGSRKRTHESGLAKTQGVTFVTTPQFLASSVLIGVRFFGCLSAATKSPIAPTFIELSKPRRAKRAAPVIRGRRSRSSLWESPRFLMWLLIVIASKVLKPRSTTRVFPSAS